MNRPPLLKTSKRALAIVAMATAVSCSAPSHSATTNTPSSDSLTFFATTETQNLVTELTTAYAEVDTSQTLQTRTGSYRSLIAQLLAVDASVGNTPYMITSHLADETLWAAPIAQDGLAVIVNRANPVQALSLDDLRAIYQGRVGNWQVVGGADIPMTVVSRETGSATHAEFTRMVMGQRPVTRAARLVSSDEGMLQVIAATPGSIGYVSLANVDERVSTLSIDGVVPTLTTVGDNTYPLRSTIYVAGLVEPTGVYRAFIAWVQSPAGQAIIGQRYSPLITLPIE